jgi:predicted RNase H-like HicB family nuclease
MKLIYPAIFYPFENSEVKGFTVEFPDLPGCVTEGDSLSEALDMAVDAAGGWLLSDLEDNKDIPAASSIHSVKPDNKQGFVNLVMIDMNRYSERFSSKSIRKNLTIPQWLNSRAEKANVNFSQVLQEALLDQLKIAK